MQTTHFDVIAFTGRHMSNWQNTSPMSCSWLNGLQPDNEAISRHEWHGPCGFEGAHAVANHLGEF